MTEGKELTWEELQELYGLSDHVIDMVRHYYDFQPYDRTELLNRLKALSKEYPELTWIIEEYDVLSFSLEEGGLYLLLEINNVGFVLHLPKRPRVYDPYELQVRLFTVSFSDEDIMYSDGIAQHGYEVPDDFNEEEYNKEIDRELDEWEKYKEEIKLPHLKIIKRGLVREEKCYINIPHYHYYKDEEVILITNCMLLYALLRAAPYIIEFI